VAELGAGQQLGPAPGAELHPLDFPFSGKGFSSLLSAGLKASEGIEKL
jgi:hypothetical protein